MEAYGALGRFYDTLIQYPYAKVADEVASAVSGGKALDLFCGTGKFTLELAKRGFSVEGVDISGEMLNHAVNNARHAGQRIVFRHEDAIDFSYSSPYSLITAACDGLNYVSRKDIMQLLQRVYSALLPGGSFIFDISSPYKLREILGNNIFFEDLQGLSYFWRNKLRKSDNSVRLELSFFEQRADGSYLRYDEEQRQYIYELSDMVGMCAGLGFVHLKTLDLDTFYKPHSKTGRYLIFLRK